MFGPAAAYGPVPPTADAFNCPKCATPAQPEDTLQQCACGCRFLLVAGPIVDPARVAPTVTMTDPMVVVNWARAFQNHRAAVEPYGVSYKAKDPVIGVTDTSLALVPYHQIATVALRRRIDWARLTLGLVFAPAFVWLLVVAVEVPVMFVFAAPIGALAAWALWLGAGRQLHIMRLCGYGCSIAIYFDGSKKRRSLFVAETLRRIGAPDLPLP